MRPPPLPPPPPFPPKKPGTPTQQPNAPRASGSSVLNTAGRQVTQTPLTQTYPDLQGKVHPDVELAIRNLYTMMYDAQAGIITMQQQTLGGAVAQATLTGTAISSIAVSAGGYYLVVPTVTTVPDGGADLTAVLTGNRVTSVTIGDGGDFASTPELVFAVP